MSIRSSRRTRFLFPILIAINYLLFRGAFRCFPRKKKYSHGGHGVHGGFERYRACASAVFLILVLLGLKPGSTD